MLLILPCGASGHFEGSALRLNFQLNYLADRRDEVPSVGALHPELMAELFSSSGWDSSGATRGAPDRGHF